MLACGCMDLGRIAWALAERGVVVILLVVAGTVLVMGLAAGALVLVLRAVRRRRGDAEPAGEPAALADFHWEEERDER
ncbi:hypothetical protein ACWGI8_27455 [Streptomyces sp. NPDC054841]